jgi:hypothetical protein
LVVKIPSTVKVEKTILLPNLFLGQIAGALVSGDGIYVIHRTLNFKKPAIKASFLYPGRELNPHDHYWPQDFKSCVSTNSTTRAETLCVDFVIYLFDDFLY